MAGPLSGKGAAISLTVAGPSLSLARMARRVGSASAAKVVLSWSATYFALWLSNLQAIYGWRLASSSPEPILHIEYNPGETELRRALLVLPIGLALAFCAGDGERPSAVDSTASGSGSPLSAHENAALIAAAERVVAFLRGTGPFHEIALGDTVTLLVSPEGGGMLSRVDRAHLRDRANWRIESPADRRRSYALVPPASHTELTMRVGTHFNCLEYALASRDAELARLPHVGTRLTPPDSRSCLQSFNLTLVFDAAGEHPTLVAAVYDQWEW